MNYFNEIKEDVLNNKNTAQTSLESILENTNKNITELSLRESLDGDIDFSILKSMNFGLVNSIIIGKGNVTSIKNIPETVTSIIIQGNLIEELNDLPKNLESLHVTHNYLKTIDLYYLKQLKTLYLDNNRIEKLEKFPSSLNELSVTYNDLNELNLDELNNLQNLNISNNPISIIENLPEKLVEFKHDNTRSIEFRQSSHLDNILGGNTEEEINKEKEMQKNYKDSLHSYFELKSKYEKKLYNLKKSAHAREYTKKRKNLAVKAVVAPCIKCERKVGSLFYKKDNIYFAKCGDTNQPCNLDIRLHDGQTGLLVEYLQFTKLDVDETKENIIKHKLDTLFNYIDENDAAQLYQTYLESFNLDNSFLTNYMNKYNELFQSNVKSETIQEKNNNVFGYIQDIQKLLSSYKETNNDQLIKDAVEIHVNHILPELRNIQNIKYEIMEMEINESTKVSTLVQIPNILTKLEEQLDKQRVEKYIV